MKFLTPVLALILLFVVSCSSNEVVQTPAGKKADAYYGKGTTELVNKNYSQALSHLQNAKEFNPKDSKVRNNLGMAYYFREQYALAEEELKEAISLDKKNTDAHLNLGSLYMFQNKVKEARFHFEKVMEDLTYANQYRNYYNLALLSLKEGDRRMAFEYLAKSIKEKDDYCLAHFKQGELYAEEYRFQQALKAFKESGKGTCVSEPAPHYQQALALINLNKPEEAKRKFQEIVEKFPSTRFGTLAAVQIKKISNNNEQQTSRSSQRTEVIKESKPVETPNF